MEPYKCARLTVPMDYHRPLNGSKDNPRVHIAMILVPGKHTGSKKFSNSPLLLNPGGPGGSGTMFALGLGERIHSIVGNQDIIGFDPRGIGATTPRADCFSYPLEGFETTEREDYVRGNFHRILWQQSGREVGIVNSSSRSLQKLGARARTVAKLCEDKDLLYGKDSILKYAHTPSVARDMISIIDAWDEWTESLSAGNQAENVEDESRHKGIKDEAESSHNPNTRGKLVYWGFSYGVLDAFPLHCD
jgi:pimeloyl-ACP methyl ester carboxylesterase